MLRFARLMIGSELLEQAYGTSREDQILIDELYQVASEHYQAQEVAHRLECLKGIGLEGKLKVAPEQTVARTDVIALFPMAQRNLDAVVRIYEREGVKLPPTVESLEVPDAFMKGEEAYRNTFAYLREVVPAAVDRAIAKYKSQAPT
jgi:hypothetical protein